MKKKSKIWLSAALALLLCCGIVTAMGTGTKAKAAEGNEYVPAFTEFKADTFEGLSGSGADYMYHNTAMLYCEGQSLQTVTGAANKANILAGETSLKWSPGKDWTLSTHVAGITDKKIGGIEGGYLIRLSMKVKLVDVSALVIHARNPAGGAIIQNMTMTEAYERDRNGTIDSDPETDVVITKQHNDTVGDFATLEFTFRGPLSFTPYFEFGANGKTEDCAVYFDDMVLLRETPPVLEYRNYETFWQEQFETADAIADTKFGDGMATAVNIHADKSTVTAASGEAVRGEKALKLFGNTRNSESRLPSETITLAPNHYKLYYRFRYDRADEVGMYVKKADGTVLYDLVVNTSKKERVVQQSSPLFDSSDIAYTSAGIVTAYGEFAVDEQTEAYAELYFKPTHADGFAVFDDVNILRSFTPDARPTEMPPLPTAPTGRQEAAYRNLDENAAGVKANRNRALSAALGVPVTTGQGVGIIALIALGCAVVVLGGFAIVKGSKRFKRGLQGVLMSALLAGTACMSFACTKKPAPPTADPVPAGYQMVYPQRITGKLDNPGMGWVLLEEPTYGGHVDMGASGEFPEVDNISFSTSWAHIEVEEDVFDFSVLDKAIAYWTGIGKHINFRICTDTLMLPYTYKGVPDWLVEKYNVGYEVVDYLDDGPVKQHKVLDLRDKNYLRRLGIFLNAMNEKYKDNPMIDVVEIRGFGVWGEWHTGHSFESKTDRMLSLQNIINNYVDAYAESGKTLVVSCSWDPDFIRTGEYDTTDDPYTSYAMWSALDMAWRTPGVTFRRDGGAGILRYDLCEKLMYEAFRSGKRLPIFGEYGNGYAKMKEEGAVFNLEDGVNDIIYKMRPNYSTMLDWVNLGASAIVANGDTDFIDRGNTMFGYRLAVEKARIPKAAAAGSTVSVMTGWSNSAVGIFPYKAPLTYSLVDANGNVAASFTDTNFDARTFVQGEINNAYTTFTIPAGIEDGTYRLAVSIETENFGKIALAMAGETAENSRMYSLGNIEIKGGTTVASDGVTKLKYSEIGSFTFAPDTTYEVTFRYLPGFDMANFYFKQNNGYEFFVQAAGGETCGNYKWQDISGEKGSKTVHFTTGSAAGGYTMKVESDSFDSIAVGDVWIERVGGTAENFDEYEETDASTIIEPVRRNFAYGVKKDDDSGLTPIYGNGSLAVEAAVSYKGQNTLAKIDTKNFAFKKGRTYTVSFDFHALENVAAGGYYLIGLGDYASITTREGDIRVIGEWYDRDDGYVTRRAFTFTPDADNQTLVFGIKHGGGYLIDNLTLTEYWAGTKLDGTDKGFKRNQIPTFENLGFGKTETFEDASFARSGFEWGQFAWGRMTFDPAEVVNYSDTNKVSLLGRVEPEAYDPAIDNVWFEFARSKRKYYPFEGGKTYKVTFNYKILKAFGSGKTFVFFRDDTLSNRFEEVVGAPVGGTDEQADLTTGKSTGRVYTYEATFTLKNHKNYQFMICMNGLWEISVDDILFEEVTL